MVSGYRHARSQTSGRLPTEEGLAVALGEEYCRVQEDKLNPEEEELGGGLRLLRGAQVVVFVHRAQLGGAHLLVALAVGRVGHLQAGRGV